MLKSEGQEKHSFSLNPVMSNSLGCSSPGSSVRGIFQARVLEWLPFSSPGDLPDPGMEPMASMSPILEADSLPAESSRKPVF